MTLPDNKALIEDRLLELTQEGYAVDNPAWEEPELKELRRRVKSLMPWLFYAVDHLMADALEQTQARLEEARRAAFFYRSTGLLGERIPGAVDDRFLASLQDDKEQT